MSDTGPITPRGNPALLSIVAPAYNEAEVLETFVARVADVMTTMGQAWELVLVNDGSTDETLALMHAQQRVHPEIGIVDLSRNFGKELALTAGLEHASGEAIVVIDCDLQDPPELIGDMLDGYREGYDVVLAQRSSRAGESWIKKNTASAFYSLMQRVGPVQLPENVGDFRLLSRAALDALLQLPERTRFMKGLFAWIGFPSKTIPYDRDARAAGQSKWNYAKLINLSIEGITSFTVAPLRLATWLGLVVALGAFGFGVWFIIKTLIFGDPVPGFPSLIVTILFLGGVQLLALGILGEYIGRIFMETKGRPLYLARDVRPSQAAQQRMRSESG